MYMLHNVQTADFLRIADLFRKLWYVYTVVCSVMIQDMTWETYFLHVYECKNKVADQLGSNRVAVFTT